MLKPCWNCCQDDHCPDEEKKCFKFSAKEQVPNIHAVMNYQLKYIFFLPTV